MKLASLPLSFEGDFSDEVKKHAQAALDRYIEDQTTFYKESLTEQHFSRRADYALVSAKKNGRWYDFTFVRSPRGGAPASKMWSKRPITIYEEPVDAIEAIPSDPALAYRGMSAEEYESIQATGTVQSAGSHNLGDIQKGLTFFAPEPDGAAYYASGFSPWQYKPSIEAPGYVIAVDRKLTIDHTQNKGVPEGELAITGSVGRDQIRAVWKIVPSESEPVKFELEYDTGTGKTKERQTWSGGPSGWQIQKVASLSGDAWISPSGEVHSVYGSHAKWAHDFLIREGVNPVPNTLDSIDALLERGWIRKGADSLTVLSLGSSRSRIYDLLRDMAVGVGYGWFFVQTENDHYRIPVEDGEPDLRVLRKVASYGNEPAYLSADEEAELRGEVILTPSGGRLYRTGPGGISERDAREKERLFWVEQGWLAPDEPHPADVRDREEKRLERKRRKMVPMKSGMQGGLPKPKSPPGIHVNEDGSTEDTEIQAKDPVKKTTASHRLAAETLRQLLLDDLEDVRNGARFQEGLWNVVLADAGIDDLSGDLTDTIRELEEQVQNASIGQIAAYAEDIHPDAYEELLASYFREAKKAKVKTAKFQNERSMQCLHCGGFLDKTSLVHNPNHIWNPGILYECGCGKAKLWCNSVRNDKSLIEYLEGRSPFGYYRQGFCFDWYCGFTFTQAKVISNEYPMPGGRRANLIGNPDHPTNQILWDINKEYDGRDTKPLEEWYRRHLSELKEMTGYEKTSSVSTATIKIAFPNYEQVDWSVGRPIGPHWFRDVRRLAMACGGRMAAGSGELPYLEVTFANQDQARRFAQRLCTEKNMNKRDVTATKIQKQATKIQMVKNASEDFQRIKTEEDLSCPVCRAPIGAFSYAWVDPEAGSYGYKGRRRQDVFCSKACARSDRKERESTVADVLVSPQKQAKRKTAGTYPLPEIDRRTKALPEQIRKFLGIAVDHPASRSLDTSTYQKSDDPEAGFERERYNPHGDVMGHLPSNADGYPLIYYTGDGDPLCAGCATAELDEERGFRGRGGDLEFVDIYYEGPTEFCSDCGKEIESAYGDPDAEEGEEKEASKKAKRKTAVKVVSAATKARWKRQSARTIQDSHNDADELLLYAENTGELYPARQEIEKQLRQEMANGTYSRENAARLFRSWFDRAATMYRQEIGSTDHIFSPTVRMIASSEMATRFEAEEKVQKGASSRPIKLGALQTTTRDGRLVFAADDETETEVEVSEPATNDTVLVVSLDNAQVGQVVEETEDEGAIVKLEDDSEIEIEKAALRKVRPTSVRLASLSREFWPKLAVQYGKVEARIHKVETPEFVRIVTAKDKTPRRVKVSDLRALIGVVRGLGASASASNDEDYLTMLRAGRDGRREASKVGTGFRY